MMPERKCGSFWKRYRESGKQVEVDEDRKKP